jgi:hypothetical protein
MLEIKKYANGRLFNTATKKYIRQDELAKIVKKGEAIKVTLSKTGEDITATVMADLSKDKTAKKTSTKKEAGKKKAAKKAETKKDAKAAKKDAKAKKKSAKKEKGESIFPKTDKFVKWISEVVDTRVNTILDIVKLPSRKQVVQLDKNIQALNAKIDGLIAAQKTEKK